MTPIEELRGAAALIRERAQAATPGPWVDAVDGLVWADRLGDPVSGSEQVEDAEHIAAADPLTMLAVADWLDATADGWVIPDPHDEGEYCPECRVFHAALKVARAYLRAGASEAVSGG